MRLSIARWLRPSLPTCILCGRDGASAARASSVRHPEPAAVLQHLCGVCYSSIPWIVKPACMICGRPEACPDCPRRPDRSIIFSRCAVRYDDTMRDLLALYKYRGSEKLEGLMAAMLAYSFEQICTELVSRGSRPHFHLITSVPLAGERLEERGFNQAERMASALAEWYGLTYQPALQRNRHTAKQSLKNRKNRITDLRGTFSSILNHKHTQLQSTGSGDPVRILLTDDIYTTGSTLNECADTLRTAISSDFKIPQERVEIYGLIWARS